MNTGAAAAGGETVRVSEISGGAGSELDPDLVAAITIAVLES